MQLDDSSGNIEVRYVVDTVGTELLVIDMPVLTRKTVSDREHLGITAGLDKI